MPRPTGAARFRAGTVVEVAARTCVPADPPLLAGPPHRTGSGWGRINGKTVTIHATDTELTMACDDGIRIVGRTIYQPARKRTRV